MTKLMRFIGPTVVPQHNSHNESHENKLRALFTYWKRRGPWKSTVWSKLNYVIRGSFDLTPENVRNVRIIHES